MSDLSYCRQTVLKSSVCSHAGRLTPELVSARADGCARDGPSSAQQLGASTAGYYSQPAACKGSPQALQQAQILLQVAETFQTLNR